MQTSFTNFADLASHILLQTEGKDEGEVRARAEKLLKQVKAGADFGALAKEHSEDEVSAAQSGDLDYFGRGRMVKEFEDVAFSWGEFVERVAASPGEELGDHLGVEHGATGDDPLQGVRQVGQRRDPGGVRS